MHFLDPQRAMDALKDGVVEQVRSYFPIKGRRRTLTLKGVGVDDKLDPDDFRSQRSAKMKGRSWTVPLMADLELTDNDTGKVVDRAKINLVSIPKMTQRYSYIVDGNEYQVDNLWKLKSGVYSRIQANGELESQWNLAKGKGFKVFFLPARGQFKLQYGDSNIALYPILDAMGVSDDAMRRTWGDAILKKSKAVKSEQELAKFHKAVTGDRPASPQAAADLVRETFAETEMLPDVNRITLGRPFDKVTGAALLVGSAKLLGISRGELEPDSRDALMFKTLWGTEDFVADRLRKSRYQILSKVGNNLDRPDKKIRDIVGYGLFNNPVKGSFTSSSVATTVPQINPLEMIAGRLKTTVIGPKEGGISDDHAVTEEAKLVDPSHLGFLDSLETPESARVGVTLYLTLGARKKGLGPAIHVYNPKSHKAVEKTPGDLHGKVVGFPDQYVREGGRLRPKSDKVKVRDENGEIDIRPAKDVDFILPSSKLLFSATSNMVPFLSSDQGNRVGMATRHLEQAISLKGREAPLVQNATEVGVSFEDIYGKFMSTRAKEDGVVAKVGKDSIKVRGKSGKLREYQLYDNFPLNDSRTGIWSVPAVGKGDKVKAGQLLADTSYTKDGTLSLGRNMRVAYLPWKGYNFEDGVVISETAARKMTSEHLYKEGLREDRSTVLDKSKYKAYAQGRFTPDQMEKVDDDGLVKEGTVLKAGDPIALVLKRKDATAASAKSLAHLHKSLIKPFSDQAQVWKHDFDGRVVEVSRHGKDVRILIRTEEPIQVGDKISGRHGNKGIVVQILPDHEMPKDKEGEPVEILMGPTGVPGRINPGQLLETALAKAAHLDGKPYLVSNFESTQSRTITVKGHWRTVKTDAGTKKVWIKEHERKVDYTERVMEELKARGISDTEELFDPATGKSLGQVLVGRQYVLKLQHQMVKKITSRSRGAYDINRVPKKGGPQGAMSIGELGLYSLLSMGARHNIRDMSTYKSNYNEDVWAALQDGNALPPPQVPYVYDKFMSYLRAMGVDAEKRGNALLLVPFTDEQILEMSNGELEDGGRMLRGKDLKPEKGGLFDPVLTGGMTGAGWTHLVLDEPMPNPLFERAIRSLLGLKQRELDEIVAGKREVNGLLGGEALVSMLQDLDEKAELKKAEEEIKTARGQKLDRLHKKIKMLRALERAGMSAEEAYTLRHIPVLPPVMRPVSVLDDGNLNTDDLNGLYKNLSLINDRMAHFSSLMPDEEKIPLRADLYDGMKSLFGLGGAMNRTHRGILDIISPTKTGFFQNRVLRRRQDMTMRSIIVPEPEMEIDEIGLPRKAALELYKPFVVRELVRNGYKPLEAQEEIKKRTPEVEGALERAVASRPVIFKRDPALHKYNVMAFKPKLMEGMSIKIHPLVTGAYNADFDGDQMNVYVPVSPEAVREAYSMMPSRNLFSFATGQVMYQPTLDSLLGLFMATQWGSGKSKGAYGTYAQVREAFRTNNADTPITFQGKSTTIGRVLIDEALPRTMRGGKHLTDERFVLDTKATDALFTMVAKKHPSEFGRFANKMKDVGFHTASQGFSFSLKDLTLDRSVRDRIMAKADANVARIKAGPGTDKAKDDKIIAVWTKATADMRKAYAPILDKNRNKLRLMHRAGIKPQWTQLEQILWAPGLMQDATGKTVPNPVRRSYSEGLDTADYWLATVGVRKGLVDKVLQVRKPGALTKQVVNSTMNQVVTDRDCGAVKGVAMQATSKEALDRYLAAPVKVRGKAFPAGTLITPEVQTSLANAKLSSKILVRSPLRCRAKEGICGRCYGLSETGRDPNLGDNIGVSAAQAVGERAAQLTMRTFHTGGTAAAGGGVVGGFARVEQLLNIPKTLPGKATLADMSGTVTKIERDPAGGHSVFVGDARHYVQRGNALKVRKGSSVSKGDPLSAGPIHPVELLERTNIHKVQGYLTDEMHEVFKGEGVKRRNLEVLVKSVTNLSRVDDPGDHPELVKGDLMPTSLAEGWNRDNPKKGRIQITTVLKGMNMLPLDMQEDWLARMNYRDLKKTVQEAAQEGWRSNIHGAHPVPALAYAKEFGQPAKGGSPTWAY